MTRHTLEPDWKGPTIQEIAAVAGVGTATVDRVLNNRMRVKEVTRRKVHDALQKLTGERIDPAKVLNLVLFCDSGETFNAAMQAAVENVNRSVSGVHLNAQYVTTSAWMPDDFAQRMVQDGLNSDGVIVVGREHPAVNGAIRRLESKGVHTVCLTTDLPSSRRSAYIGNDQYAAGSVAGQLISRALPREAAKILLIMSVPFRCQQEREMGFRRVLRSDFSHIKIDDRLVSDDVPETTLEHIMRYIDANGPPAAIYNVAGANRGVAMALEQIGRTEQTIFVGHELTPRSRQLLEANIMDYVISHDFTQELTVAANLLRDHVPVIPLLNWNSPILVHTKYNCDGAI